MNRSSARASFDIKPKLDPNSLPGSVKIRRNHETSSPKRSKIEVWGRSGRLFDLIGASMLCLGASCVCLVASWVPLRASWEPLGRRPGRILGSLGRVLEEFQAPLGASWGVLTCLGASWGRLGLDLRSKGEVDCSISSWMPFSNRYPSDFGSNNRSPILQKSFNSICYSFLLSGYLKIASLLDAI